VRGDDRAAVLEYVHVKYATGALLRNGSIFKISSSPGFKVLPVQLSGGKLGVLPWRSISPVLHDAGKVARIGLIEHGERLMCHRSASHSDEHYADQDFVRCVSFFPPSIEVAAGRALRFHLASFLHPDDCDGFINTLGNAVADFYGMRPTFEKEYNVGPQQQP
jgi:hypothetical protein